MLNSRLHCRAYKLHHLTSRQKQYLKKALLYHYNPNAGYWWCQSLEFSSFCSIKNTWRRASSNRYTDLHPITLPTLASLSLIKQRRLTTKRDKLFLIFKIYQYYENIIYSRSIKNKNSSLRKTTAWECNLQKALTPKCQRVQVLVNN